MLRKLILTETEKKDIFRLHSLLNEDDGGAILKGKTLYKGKPEPNTVVRLLQNDQEIKKTTSNNDAFYEIKDIPLGSYKIVISHEGRNDSEEDIEIESKSTYVRNIGFRETQDSEVVTVKSEKTQRFTLIDLQVIDLDNNPIGPTKIEIFDVEGNPVDITPNMTDDDGKLTLIKIDGNKNQNFKSTGQGKPWESKTNITIKVTYNGVSNESNYEVTVNNGIETKGEGIKRLHIVDRETNETRIDLRNTNKFKIEVPLLNFKITMVDEELGDVLQNVKLDLYLDRANTQLIKKGISPVSGYVGLTKSSKGEYEDKVTIYFTASKNNYITRKDKITLDKDDENDLRINLTRIPDAEPPKELDERACIKLTKSHYRNLKRVDKDRLTVNELGGVSAIKKTAADVKSCYIKYRKAYPKTMKKITDALIYVENTLDFFKMDLTQKDLRDIYGESKNMSLNNSIRRVISEAIETKTERSIIEERFNFSLVGINKKNITETKRTLRNEKYNLIRFGYNKTLVRESFLDVMKGLYGNDETNVLSDIKTRLGQRIADQVKNKQEEHEMILSAFNELPEDMIERAIKENRVDELSTEVATKALENYKTQFGTEGLSGIMIASVDENKFKQEVSKLIEPAIKDITTKMDEKLKQVQDAVSGGVNPTA
jgi:hypothetical protein